ncbi:MULTISPECIES: threonine/serine exporter family protein [Ferrimonas]|uniref:threonine/serine exporter family protein n=1 Tax=Ferrimonas TaxID=44011 RepID=UPI000421B1A4|nr:MULTISPECIES: threonine/serine exporter family protein [Ferrimonas]USD37941.1 threonine/serine exporter family protein [Ferrimonas sp. SCSIO 43195]
MNLIQLLINGAYAAVPAVGFAMVFNVPGRFLWRCALAGAVGHMLRAVCMHWGAPIEWATFAAAVAVGGLSTLWSRQTLAPMQLFGVAAIIPMIPGTFAFNTVIGLVEMSAIGVTDATLMPVVYNALKTIFILGALSVGLAMPSLLLFRTKSII